MKQPPPGKSRVQRKRLTRRDADLHLTVDSEGGGEEAKEDDQRGEGNDLTILTERGSGQEGVSREMA